MSVHEFRRFDLVCEHISGKSMCLCDFQGMDDQTEEEVKDDAREEGWVVKGDKCFCPLHAKSKQAREAS